MTDDDDDLAEDLAALAAMRIKYRSNRRVIDLIDRAMTIITAYLDADDDRRLPALVEEYERLAAELRASAVRVRPTLH
jgi:hypothetical protein